MSNPQARTPVRRQGRRLNAAQREGLGLLKDMTALILGVIVIGLLGYFGWRN